MTRLLWLIVPLVFWGCEPSEIDEQSVEVSFDQTKLSIPKKYLLPSFPSALIPSQGMDKDAGASLRISLQDLGYQIGNGVGFRYTLMISMTSLSIVYPPNRLPPSGLAAWNGSGLFKDRHIEFDRVTQLYRVYDDAKYRESWQFFKSSPTRSKSPEEEWVARCSVYTQKEIPDLSNVTCDTVFLYKDIHVEMTLSGMYLKLREEFEQKVLELFRSWEF